MAKTRPPYNYRFVIFDNLPNTAEAAQVTQLVRGHGRILKTDMFDLAEKRVARVEFLRDDEAGAFVKYRLNNSAVLLDGQGNECRPRIWSPTCVKDPRPPSQMHQALVHRGGTRTVRIEQPPIGAIWFWLCALGLKNIAHVEYRTGPWGCALAIEFNRIFAADQAWEAFNRGQMPPYNPTNLSDVAMEEDATTTIGPWNRLIRPGHIERAFHRIPFDRYWPGQPWPIMAQQGLEPRTLNQHWRLRYIEHQAQAEPQPANKPSLMDQINVSVLQGLGPDREEYRNGAGNGPGDLSRWDEYSAIAEHRRRKCAQLGLPPGYVPKCDNNCKFGCGEMRVGRPQMTS